MKYLARTTPIRHCLPGLVAFDSALRDAFCASTGLALDPQAWKQAQLPVASGGLGLRSAVDFADAAYIGSRLLVLERCHALWTPAAWDGSDGGNELGLAIARCNGLLQQIGLFGGSAGPQFEPNGPFTSPPGSARSGLEGSCWH